MLGFELRKLNFYSPSYGPFTRNGLSGKFVRLGLIVHVRPPTSNCQKLFVRTSFWVFLDSMESPFSQDSSHISVENSV